MGGVQNSSGNSGGVGGGYFSGQKKVEIPGSLSEIPSVVGVWIFSETTHYEDLLNSVQRHTQCSTAYCLHKKSNKSVLLCRFNFPKECYHQTHLEYEKLKSKDGVEHYKVKVVTKRDDNCLNNHQRLQLQGWRANL